MFGRLSVLVLAVIGAVKASTSLNSNINSGKRTAKLFCIVVVGDEYCLRSDRLEVAVLNIIFFVGFSLVCRRRIRFQLLDLLLFALASIFLRYF